MTLPALNSWIRGPVAVTTAALLVALTTAPVGATPTGPGAGGTVTIGAATAKAKLASTGASSTRVTLVTGDTVTYSRDGAGHTSVTVLPRADRSDVVFRAHTDENGYYLIPSDAQDLVTAGVLDKELFNLTYLADNGYTDEASGQLPLIVQYRQQMAAATVRQKAEALPSSTASLTLNSINGAAVRVDKKQAGSFWDAVRGTAGTAVNRPNLAPSGRTTALATPAQLGAGLARVWLDAKVKPFDDVSNPQIGAPVAWAAGYDGTGVDVGVIDTGIDSSHPDLAGKVVSSRNFVPAGQPGGGDQADVTDRVGHGTHVASIIAGTGAASGGRYKGVAPGTRLIVAKALDDTGSGFNSTVIEAMQWEAATAHARVVNMSLGSEPTDGTDPVSQAVNDLTERYGTLFVIAAGNSGPGRNTVSAPGAASSALTVGAVDSADKLASFSSRGPRWGDDFGVKPEIAAPGVNIVAARAAGTSLGAGSSVPGGGPIDDHYTAASGTSMATPHVAAAAAVLTQEHPDWTPAQIKAALVGTAHDVGYSAYQQGAGQLDVGRAVSQTVFDDTSSVSTGFAYPYNARLTRQITYRNTGSTAVTLNLSSSAVRADGVSAATGMVSVSPTSLTVPAHGTATAELTIDPAVGEVGLYTGRVLATNATGDRLTVPLGFYKQPRQDTLRLRVVGTATRPTPPAMVNVVRVNNTSVPLQSEPVAWALFPTWQATGAPYTFEADVQLPEGGIYALNSSTFWRDNTDGTAEWAMLERPEVRLDHDATVTFDLHDLVPISVDTPRPSVPVVVNVQDSRTAASGTSFDDATVFSYQPSISYSLWMLPTEEPTVGSYLSWFDQTRIAPQVTAAVAGGHHVDLHPVYASDANDVPKFTSDQRLDMVSEAGLRAGRNVRGQLVVLDPAPLGDQSAFDRFLDVLTQAIRGGAAGILTDSVYSWVVQSPLYRDYMKIPLLWVTKAEAARVRAALTGPGHPRIDIHSTLVTPYEYKLAYYLGDHVPHHPLTFDVKARDLTEITTTYHAQYRNPLDWGDGPDMIEVNHTFVPGQGLSVKASHSFAGPARRTEYYNVLGPQVLSWRAYTFWDPAPDGLWRAADSFRGFAHATREQEDWNETILPAQTATGPQLPSWYDGAPCDSCRQGDILRIRSLAALGIGEYSGASDSNHDFRGAFGTEETHLFRGDTEIQPQPDAVGLPYYTLPKETAIYRLTDTFTDGFTARHTGTTVTTTWTFRSSRPTTDTVRGTPHECIDTLLYGNTNPCAFQPLIYLNYNLGLAPDDTAPAGHRFTCTVTAQDGVPEARASLAGLRVWISADGGAHWTSAHVEPGHDRSYQVSVTNPKVAGGRTGTVAIKAQAWDAAGNSVEQVIQDAYVLR